MINCLSHQGAGHKAHLDSQLASVFQKSFSPFPNILSPYHLHSKKKNPAENLLGKRKERGKSQPRVARLCISPAGHKAKIEIAPRKDVKRSFTVHYNIIVTWLCSNSPLGK